MAFVDQQLGGDVALFRQLRLFEALARMLEIGARILPVGVQKEFVEPVVQIVMARDIAPRPGSIVALVEVTQRYPKLVQVDQPPWAAAQQQVAFAQLNHVVEIAVSDLEPSVHVEFAERQGRIEHYLPLGCPIRDANAEPGACAIAKGSDGSVRALDFEAAHANQLREEIRKQRTHVRPHTHPSRAVRPARRQTLTLPQSVGTNFRICNIRFLLTCLMLRKSSRSTESLCGAVQTHLLTSGIALPISAAHWQERERGAAAPNFAPSSFAPRDFRLGMRERSSGASRRPTAQRALVSATPSAASERSEMYGSLLKKIFGSSNDRRLKGYRPKVAAINALEAEFAALSDEQLRAKTVAFRAEIAAGKSLDELLAPAFAAVREAAKRTLKQRHFDVQLIGGMVLHEGAIAEMRTGEGKTLVATLAVYLNALAGKGVHVVTVNDYLASRDSEWMGQIYGFLGMSVGVIVHGLDDDQRRQSYAADITYGTNNEFGFDYLRDNMKYDMSQMVQRGHEFAIVDEVDSILVDEARTPLIISGPSEDRSGLYVSVNALIPQLFREDYDIDEKQRTVNLTEAGNEHAEALLRAAGIMKEGSLYEAANATLVHHVNQALRAHKLFQKDKEYIVRNNEVVIVDEFTGRMMPGRRYSEGLHQALEAKEGVTVQPENVTLASITFQNYFRLYKKLAGMTGTAATEADEFAEIYKLTVVEIPTHRPVARKDEDDEVYRSGAEKLKAVVREIDDASVKLQPMLVGTTSIEKSEQLGRASWSSTATRRSTLPPPTR